MNHAQATAAAALEDCMACDAPAPSLPAHYPEHRGMGGRKDFWGPDHWVPLCFRCHEALDGRMGQSQIPRRWKAYVTQQIEARRPAWLRRWGLA